MASINIPITNGVGSVSIIDGTYTVTSSTNGFDNTSILPTEQAISSGVSEYAFTIAATGTLTLHVTDDGTDVGVPIEGATFYRCTSDGTHYGNVITSNSDGEAVFEYVPFAENDAPTIYYVQTGSDGEHTFTDTVQSTTLTTSTATVEVENPDAPERTIKLTDANYSGLPIEDGTVILSN